MLQLSYVQLDAYCNSVYWQVMECNWDSLLKKVREAEDLDQIISAHDTFLQQITSQSLLNTDGQVNCDRGLLSGASLHHEEWSINCM